MDCFGSLHYVTAGDGAESASVAVDSLSISQSE
jgi:hypothetical protein